jgi:hypothetical protein
MALTSTSPLPVATVIPDTNNSGMLTFILATPPSTPLFLGEIQITRRLSGPNVTGKIAPGTPTRAGSAFVDMNPTTYASTLAKAVLPFRVILTYDDVTKVVSNLEIVGAHTIPVRGAAVIAPS